jgi:hypothetical protein
MVVVTASRIVGEPAMVGSEDGVVGTKATVDGGDVHDA